MPRDNDLIARLHAALQQSDLSQSDAPGLASAQEISASRSPTPGDRNSSVAQLLTAGFAALDLLNIGVIVCGVTGEMLVANNTARAIVRARDGLELDAGGGLSATHDKNASLGDIIRRVAKTSGTGEAGTLDSAFALRRPSGKRALTLFVRAVNGVPETAGAQKGAVLVMILDAAVPVETTEAELRQLYGFTATEAQVANLLMEGRALEGCCEELGIRRSTVRMHLRNIFAKTGVRRQGELVSLLLKSIGLGPRITGKSRPHE